MDEMKQALNRSGVAGDFTHEWNIAWSLTTSLWGIGGMVGALIGGPMSQKLGRKFSLISNNIFLICGSVLQCVPFMAFGQGMSLDKLAYLTVITK